MRTAYLKLAVSTVLVVVSVPVAMAQTGPANQGIQPPSFQNQKKGGSAGPVTKINPVVPQQNMLTPERLAILLRADGHLVDIRPMTADKFQTVVANIYRDGWRFTIEFEFTPGGKSFNMVCPLGEPTSQFPATQLFELIKKNYTLPMPMRFSYRDGDHRLCLEDPNCTTTINDDLVRQIVQRLITTAQQTYPLWNPQNWTGNSQSTTNPGFGTPPVNSGFGTPPVNPGFGVPPVNPGFGTPPVNPGFGLPPGLPKIN